MAGRRVKDFLSVQVGRFHFLGQHVLRPLSFLRQRVKGGVLDRKPQSTQRHPGGRYRDGVCRSAGSTLKTSHALWLPENARHIIRQRIDFEFYPHIFSCPYVGYSNPLITNPRTVFRFRQLCLIIRTSWAAAGPMGRAGSVTTCLTGLN